MIFFTFVFKLFGIKANSYRNNLYNCSFGLFKKRYTETHSTSNGIVQKKTVTANEQINSAQKDAVRISQITHLTRFTNSVLFCVSFLCFFFVSPGLSLISYSVVLSLKFLQNIRQMSKAILFPIIF